MVFENLSKVYEMAIAYIGNGRYFAFATAALLFLYVTSKKIRPRLIYPTLLIIVLIGTPWLYQYIFNRDAYWRTFWMFPGGILIALFCVRLIQACETVGERVGMTVFLLLLLCFMGTSMYSAEKVKNDGSKERILSEVSNPEKIKDGSKQVADILLTLEDNPNVITRKKYIYELRQYSSKIKLYYGRDIDGFIIPITQKKGWRAEVHKELESSSPNYYRILRIADDSGYNYVITSSYYRIPEEILDRYGYCEVAIVDRSAIYYKENPNGSITDKEEETESAEQSQEDVTDEVAESVEQTQETVTEEAVSEESVSEAVADSASDQGTSDTADEVTDSAGDAQEAHGTELLEQFAENS